jgi:hypothetical protein
LQGVEKSGDFVWVGAAGRGAQLLFAVLVVRSLFNAQQLAYQSACLMV